MKDMNLVCGSCGGQLVKIKKARFNRTVYNCEQCKKNILVECTVCHKPRMLWADEGQTICAICYTDYQDGKNNLTPSQIEKIREHQKRLRSKK
jgi:16S rRNA U1498 N3-methylase RsmE